MRWTVHYDIRVEANMLSLTLHVQCFGNKANELNRLLIRLN